MRPAIFALMTLCACDRMSQVGKAPEFTPLEGSYQHHAMYSNPMPEDVLPPGPTDGSSLWTAGKSSLFGDRRAMRRGDILTVVIEINDSATMKNTSARSRTGTETMSIPSLFGLPENAAKELASGATLDPAVDTSGSSSYKGNGTISRNEKLTLRIAATIVEELPNGVLRIEGVQDVRVNFELRELVVTGYVRPIDISRQNEITYDKIAGAQISYGGRGQMTDVQQPRYGQQVADVLLPF
jgi:flagellar L-ring protein FlgH